jgi:hypothetical protein
MSDELDNLAFRELKTESAIDIAIRNNENSGENFRLSDEEVEKYGNLARLMVSYSPGESYSTAPLYSVEEDSEYQERFFGENAENRDQNLELYHTFKSGTGGIGNFHVNMEQGKKNMIKAWQNIMSPILFPDLEWNEAGNSFWHMDPDDGAWLPMMDQSTIDFIDSNAVNRDRHETDKYFGRMKFAKFTKEYLDLADKTNGNIRPELMDKLFAKYDILEDGKGAHYLEPPSWIQEFQETREEGRMIESKRSLRKKRLMQDK